MHWDFALILILLGVAVPWLGQRRIRQLMQAPQTTKMDRLALYASTVAFQWTAAGVIFWRARKHGISATELGVAIPSILLVTVISIALASLVFANQIFSLRRIAARPAEVRGPVPQLALKIFPQDNVERFAFLGLVSTVAFCEELIYRGFVQRVFQDWSRGNIIAGIAASAAMFSLAHLYQGRRGLVSTFIVGILFSSVRAWTGSLVPPLVAHFVADLTAGFLAPRAVQRALKSADREQIKPSANQSSTGQKQVILYM
jgi:membrane protease YdiL (CAAX protease family)